LLYAVLVLSYKPVIFVELKSVIIAFKSPGFVQTMMRLLSKLKYIIPRA